MGRNRCGIFDGNCDLGCRMVEVVVVVKRMLRDVGKRAGIYYFSSLPSSKFGMAMHGCIVARRRQS